MKTFLVMNSLRSEAIIKNVQKTHEEQAHVLNGSWRRILRIIFFNLYA